MSARTGCYSSLDDDRARLVLRVLLLGTLSEDMLIGACSRGASP
jgi:hypothetical protein